MDACIKEVESLLEKTSFKKNYDRKKLCDKGAQIMHLGNIYRPFHGYYETVETSKNTELFEALKKLANLMDPSFPFSTITINKNVLCKPHRDRNNQAGTMIIGLGNYYGGELCVGDEVINIRHKPHQFDGAKHTHWTKDWIGDRYSVMYFRNRKSALINI